MLSKRVPQPTEKAQAIHEDHQCKRTANDADTTSKQNKRSRIETSVKAKVSPQSSFNSTTNSDSTPWPTDHKSASAMEATSTFSECDCTMDTVNSDAGENNEEQGEMSEAEMGKCNDGRHCCHI